MNMNYFRFLYGETRGCFLHFGELRNSMTEERMTFLYLRGTDGHVNQEKSDHTLFLCPKEVDLVVLGRTDGETLEAWSRLRSTVKADTLVYSGSENIGSLAAFEEEQTGEHHESAGERSGEKSSVSCKIVNLAGEENTYCRKGAGWNFFVKSYEAGSVVMVHGPLVGGCQERAEEELRCKVEDCVMNVKPLDKSRRCAGQCEPDGYGCALGCVLHQDYDVCKYQKEGGEPGTVSGTVLLSGTESTEILDRLQREENIRMENIRFFAVPRERQHEAVASWIMRGAWEQEKKGCRRYIAGMGEGMDRVFLEKICEEGFFFAPVVLKEGRGICCSGLLKYAEAAEIQ